VSRIGVKRRTLQVRDCSLTAPPHLLRVILKVYRPRIILSAEFHADNTRRRPSSRPSPSHPAASPTFQAQSPHLVESSPLYHFAPRPSNPSTPLLSDDLLTFAYGQAIGMTEHGSMISTATDVIGLGDMEGALRRTSAEYR
jgi:hypothetical protein